MKIALSILLLVLTKAAVDWTPAEHIIESAINEGLFSGCVLGIATNNATLFKKAYGTLGPKRGLYAPPVTVDLKFDIGYLTEPIGINSAIMELYDQNKLNTTTRASTLFFDFDNNGKRYITLQNLLEHNSGCTFFIQVYQLHTPLHSQKLQLNSLKPLIPSNLSTQPRPSRSSVNWDPSFLDRLSAK